MHRLLPWPMIGPAVVVEPHGGAVSNVSVKVVPAARYAAACAVAWAGDSTWLRAKRNQSTCWT